MYNYIISAVVVSNYIIMCQLFYSNQCILEKMSVAASSGDDLQLVSLKGLDGVEESVNTSSQDQPMARNTSRAR